MTENQILDLLREVRHPAKGDRDLVDLDMVSSVSVSEGRVEVELAFPKRRDPLAEYLVGSARAALYRGLPGGTEIDVKAVVRQEEEPRKRQNVNDLTLDEVAQVRHIIGIASGKGGVGKSTVAVNLAVALARLGYRVGLADADEKTILPIEKYGVKWMSIGYFAQPGQALVWRGPMACNALKQMILQVQWGPLDFLLVDMPPGTGDIHITLVGDIPMEGAVIVTTPQAVALADVEKGVDMFRNEKVNRKIFGLVENMAWFTPEELPQNKYYIFGKEGGLKMAERLGIPLLGQIPIVESIRQSGDAGEPAALSSRPDGLAFLELAQKLAESV